ncbi:hypothetical protein BDY21DRAFT_425201 [Lineolata rhizophorae]|uniref:SUZ-C domain-containing protein n=1 Tax=Lineolata rhizophorae TaxID=578093 RepID=A0A6A6NL40_9PEZI|nr:hypothetical protein BDY21DRAFT_425201 [Lineolata rhizophorae]
MGKKSAVPDAWDDDWETIADKQEETAQDEHQTAEAKISRSERRAKHAEENKRLWESAEAPEPNLFLETQASVPLTSDFKPAVKVLSRKPPPKIASRASPSPSSAASAAPADALSNLSLQDGPATADAAAAAADEDDVDSEEEERRRIERSYAERAARAAREREDKARRYQERREQLFGPSRGEEGGGGGAGSRSGTTPGRGRSGRGKGRGGARGAGAGGAGGREHGYRSGHASPSSADQSPARPPSGAGLRRLLFDPNCAAKPHSVSVQRRENPAVVGGKPAHGGGVAALEEQEPIRAPRGPDGTGRGGFGFAARGGSKGAMS